MKRKKAAWEMTVAVLVLSLLRGLGEMIHTGPGRGNIFYTCSGMHFSDPFMVQKGFLLPGF